MSVYSMIIISRPVHLILWLGVAASLIIGVPGESTSSTPSPSPESSDSSSPPNARLLPSMFFGLQMHTLTSPDHERSARAAAQLGARCVRDECPWNYVEQKKGILHIPDQTLANFRINKSLGLETLLILDYGNPLYDEGRAPSTPEAVEAFGRYCEFMARELKDLCRYFEIWNEPNTDGFWSPHKDPKDYAQLMQTAIHRIRLGNPNAFILGGALSQIDGDFMKQVCSSTDCASLDAFSIHPYCTPASPGKADIFFRMNALRRELFNGPGRSRPLWVTETGYPTNEDGGVSERRQSEVLSQMYLLGAVRPELECLIWYWMGPDGPQADYSEDRFGLFHQQFQTRKPAAYPFDVLSHTFSGARVSTEIERLNEFSEEVPDSYIIRAIDPQGRHLTALFVESGEHIVGIPNLPEVEVIPLTGAPPRILVPDNDRLRQIRLTVSSMPILLRSAAPPKFLFCPYGPLLLLTDDHFSTQIVRGSNAKLGFYEAMGHWIPKIGPALIMTILGYSEMESDPSPLPWSCTPRIIKQTQTMKDFSSQSSPRSTSQTGGPVITSIPDVWVGPNVDASTTASSILDLHVAPDARPQTAPLVVYWTPFLETRPIARIVLNLEVIHPLKITARPFNDPQNGPSAALSIVNCNNKPIDAKVQTLLEDLPRQIWRISGLPPDSEARPFWTIGTLPSPDSVLECRTDVELTSRVIQSDRTYLSWMTSEWTSWSIKVDGDLSDWPRDRPPIRFGNRNQLTSERIPWKGPEDNSARLWTSWDDQWFYIAAEVCDDVFVEDATGGTIYNNDGIEIYLDVNRPVGRTLDHYTPDQFQYGFFPSEGKDIVFEWHQIGGPSPGAKIKINRSPKPEQRLDAAAVSCFPRYIIEGAIPLSEIHLKPEPGLELGFTAALNDDDTPGSIDPFKQDKQMQWSRQKNAWQRPSAFVSLWIEGGAKHNNSSPNPPKEPATGQK